MTRAYIGVGANIDPAANILRALALLHKQERVTVLASSTFYRTAPLNRPEQEDYANGVWSVETDAAPYELKLEILRDIETALGRIRSADACAARPIDLDLLLYGDRVVDEDSLALPDPDIRTRPFVAIPLLELAPELVFPDTGESLRSVVASMDAAALTPLPELSRQLKERIAP